MRKYSVETDGNVYNFLNFKFRINLSHFSRSFWRSIFYSKKTRKKNAKLTEQQKKTLLEREFGGVSIFEFGAKIEPVVKNKFSNSFYNHLRVINTWWTNNAL